MAESDATRGFLNHLSGAVQRALRMTNDVAVWFDASPADVVLASVAREQSDVPLWLVTVAEGDMETLAQARRVARHLGLDLVEVRTEASQADQARRDLAGATGLAGADAESWIGFFLAAREARLHTRRFLVAAAAPARWDRLDAVARDASIPQRIGRSLDLDIRDPYRDRGLAPYMERVHGSAEPKLDLLEAAAVQLGLPRDLLKPRPGPREKPAPA